MSPGTANTDLEVITQLLADLVHAQSVNPPGNEQCAAMVLHDFLADYGIESTLDEVEPGRPNLIASIGSGSPRFLLTSHLDVVVPGERSSWDHDPFTAHVENGILYGRGACDAKGHIAGMAHALVTLKDSPPCQVVLAAVMGEEKGGLGSKHLTAKDSNFDVVIVGESTQLDIAISQNGRIGIFLDFIGKANHPTKADLHANPVFHLAKVMNFLQSFAQRVLDNRQGSFVVLEVSAGQKGVLTPPQRCSLTLSWWFSAQMNHDDAIDAFHSEFEAFARTNNIPFDIRFHRGAGSYAIKPNHPFVQTVKTVIESVTGNTPAIAPFPASCDMYVFGRKGIPTIIFGPGDLDLAHAPNESIPLAQVQTASRIYCETIKALACNHNNND